MSDNNSGVVTIYNSAGIFDYISELNFGLMLGGEARYDRLDGTAAPRVVVGW